MWSVQGTQRALSEWEYTFYIRHHKPVIGMPVTDYWVLLPTKILHRPTPYQLMSDQ